MRELCKKSIIDKINIARHICDHLLGKDHSHTHRMAVGVLVMFFGVLFAKISTDVFALHVVCDLCGYFLHGLGALPILEKIAETQA